ncbi:Serine/threonine-protein phosphatase 2A activator 2 [Rhizoclosmatium globosum]|uniref:Serine/threonine-protein phosphatase 2A activator n=1 Tax=Rhizoclosmatium globosum TaxID=329046 RepID=A0A1Y2BUN4_9FUNG|nr:Serine/threonine-protein phosphatase 2A activator 2 [Rhizoclosmatium globosum]|eukprot:ORY38384.1 Serine/threonine-protein phosphatase 2A activator 2 [Rhizoclosmatium globosum]
MSAQVETHTHTHTHTHSEDCDHDHDHSINANANASSETETETETEVVSEQDALKASRTPAKALLSVADLERWTTSDTRAAFVAFVSRLNDAAKNKKLRDDLFVSETTQRILDLLDACEAICADVRPSDSGKSRFGNVAFQQWFDKMQEIAFPLTNAIVPDALDAHEISIYLINSFGNRKRIDYGTGHEAHFIAFLFCIEKLGLIGEQDLPAIALKVFWRYIGVMRTLQFTYWLEPAGSHGVWGLDDYNFLPFMFGSAQFYDHKHMRPKCIHDPEILEEFSKDYMYLACIKFINSVKTASLRWHSPMLDDISGVKSWQKVNSGMQKMYLAEVLSKLPIMQHFLFGTFLPFEASGEMVGEEDELGHVHALGQERPACCFIRVPSAIAAAADQGVNVAREFGMRPGMVGGALGGARPRPLPFD